MATEGKFCFSATGGERFEGEFDTREAAFEEGKSHLEEGPGVVHTVSTTTSSRRGGPACRRKRARR